MSDQYVREAYKTARGRGAVVYTLYPVIGAGVGGGTVVTGGAANTWTAAPGTAIVTPAPGVDYWFCSVNGGVASGAETFLMGVMVDLPVANTFIYTVRVGITAVTGNLGQFGPPYPIFCQSTSTLSGCLSSVSGGETLEMSILIATGL